VAKLDTQSVEIIGRNRLINELLYAGIEIAMPARDRGLDLVAYVDLNDQLDYFAAIPIQMKAASTRAFGIDRKYEKFPHLIMAFVWHVASPTDAVTYAMTYKDLHAIAEEMGYTRTPSWMERNGYSSSSPSRRVVERLEQHRMTSARWWKLVTGRDIVCT